MDSVPQELPDDPVIMPRITEHSKVGFWLIVFFSSVGLLMLPILYPMVYRKPGKYYFEKMAISLIAIIHQLLPASIILQRVVVYYPDLIPIRWINLENLNIFCVCCAFEISYIRTLTHCKRLLHIYKTNIERSSLTIYTTALFVLLTISMSIGTVAVLIMKDVLLHPFGFTSTILVYLLIFGGLLVELITLIGSIFLVHDKSSFLAPGLKATGFFDIIIRFIIFFIAIFHWFSNDDGSRTTVLSSLFVLSNLCFVFVLMMFVWNEDGVIFQVRHNRVGVSNFDMGSFDNIGSDRPRARPN